MQCRLFPVFHSLNVYHPQICENFHILQIWTRNKIFNVYRFYLLKNGHIATFCLSLSLSLSHGVVWCGVVWCGVVWCGVVWCGVVWCGVVWCGVFVCECMWAELEHEITIKYGWTIV